MKKLKGKNMVKLVPMSIILYINIINLAQKYIFYSAGQYIDEEYIESENVPEYINDMENKDEAEENENNNAACCNCRKEQKHFETVVLKKLNELLEIARNSNPSEYKRRNYPLLPPMPFSDINTLLQFDCDLKENDQMRDQFVSVRIYVLIF
ncbi:PREDICTED: uncharacterized protein LOC105559824 [Vollenhovia emeryi]|uniref:uncharacterized protein LOC105559824 n=1 Tax=Vollenhovia emeryi TaxID=411798 RepID=UPI0005F48042|nr:PREDICTED: uncharacterized protein LOC105559824 [Vollenhovia emeryi]